MAELTLDQQRALAIATAKARLGATKKPSFGGGSSGGGAGLDIGDPQEQSLMDTVYENVVGRGAIDTPGEKIGETINQAGRGFVEGAAGLADFLGMVGRPNVSVSDDAGYAGGKPPMPMIGAAPTPMQDIAKPVTDVAPQSTAAKYGRTVGQFLPGAMAFGATSPSSLAQFGVLPGVASEAAGQATEGSAIEPYARAAAAMTSPVVASLLKKPQSFSAALPGADPERVKQANTLVRSGVKPTAGQATGIDKLRQAEGSLAATGQQLDDFTAATMRSIGSQSKRATPEALKAAETTIVQQMDDALSGVSLNVSTQHGSAASKIAADYSARVPVGNLTPRIRGIADEITDIATTPGQPAIPLSKLREWRTDIGKFTVSPDGPTREAGHALRSLIDDMTDAALTASGRAENIARLQSAREQYRNLIAIKDAASRAGDEAAVGVVTPSRLQSAVVRTQGRGQYATGGGTELADLSRAGVAALAPMATVSPGAVREIAHLMPMLAGGAGYYASGGNIPAMLAAAAAPSVGRAALRSGPVQGVLANPRQALIDALMGGARVAPGIMQGAQ